MSLSNPETLLEAVTFFADAVNCHQFVARMRWADGRVRCTHCGSLNVGKFAPKRAVSNCKDCGRQFTLKLGTIFEDSKIGFTKWLPAMWMVVNSKNGISSCEIGRALGVTQKTAWFMAHRLRLAIERGSFVKMEEIVEVDESYIGGKARFMHKGRREARGITGTGMGGKTAVMGLLDRKSRKIIAEVLPSTHKKELLGRVHKYVLKDSEVQTDALSHYKDLASEFSHKVVDHAVTYVNQGVHTNGLENFWSLLKRTIKGTYVCVQPFHLHRYLGEQVYRFNERKGDDSTRFTLAMGQIEGKRLTYRDLTAKA